MKIQKMEARRAAKALEAKMEIHQARQKGMVQTQPAAALRIR